MERVIEAEWLDELPAADRRAQHSRNDLRRLNWIMSHASKIARTLRDKPAPKRVLDLGAGDGFFALRVANLLRWHDTDLILLDRNSSISADVRNVFAERNCQMRLVRRDAFDELRDLGQFDLLFTNLFLHHFARERLRGLFAGVSAQTIRFIACEPRRSFLSLIASRSVFLLGCNDVTRHDAVASIRAGFRGCELSTLWPAADVWRLTERRAGLFSHLFFAERK